MDNNKLPQKEDIDTQQKFRQQVELKEIRKLRSRRRKNRAIWFGLGMFGIIGWSVAIPTLIGVALGAWIDAKWPSRFSWTLMLLVGGLIVGCLNAWHWVKREYKEEEE
jgi:ATP synthase protein I